MRVVDGTGSGGAGRVTGDAESRPARAPQPRDAPARPGADAALLGFARALRAAGVDASAERVHAFLRAVDELRPGMRADVYWAGRLTLCGGHDDLERYERVFAAYFGEAPRARRTAPATPAPRLRLVVREGPAPGTAARDERQDTPPAAALASSTEVLRHRDVAELGAAEREQLRRLLAAFTLPGETRRSARRRPARRGEVDPHRTVRELLRRGGEPARPRRHSRAERPRRVVLLVDVSGSMAPYADALLRFAHAAARYSRTEVFTIGTRLTRVTRELSHRDPDLAMTALAETVPDWRGGTRLGELLREFLDRWGQRGMARGAVVVLLSDGWERGDPELLGAQMRRLHRLAHRVVWANPRKARPGYAPLAAGMAAALPSVDAFVEGHSLAALERLAAVVRGAERAPREGADRA
ncbi:vWA domain-containing protein [Streptomyces griseorubiginosus]|uniref:vWA domain-containing protein n=1 Tax=Streptomyces griseorubiginosus TaxID=67304 RepID=UPI003F76A091